METFAPSERVLRQGVPCPAMMIVVDGTFDIIVRHRDGPSALIGRARGGDSMGEVEAIAGRVAAADCVAVSHASCLVAPRGTVMQALQDPNFVRNLMRAQYDRLTSDNRAKLLDQFGALEQRLCEVLLRLGGDGSDIEKTQGDLAALLGCARQSLNRELRLLKERGLIDVDTGRIRILNSKGLEARVNL